MKNVLLNFKKIGLMTMILTLVLVGFSGCSSTTSTDASNASSTESSENEAETTTDGSSDDKFVIAIVQHVSHPSLDEIRDTIVDELHELGLSDQIEIKFENANGDISMLPTIMQNLLAEEVDMIVPIATPTAQAAMAATQTTPIIFSAVSYPIEAGVVTSFDDTSGNITGVSNAIAVEEIMALSKVLTPEVETFGFLYNSSEVNSASGVKRAIAYCEENGIAYKEATITGTQDIQQATSSLVGEVDALFTPNDNTVASAIATYLQVAMDANLPTYVGADSMVKDGCFATVGIDYTVLGRQTAQMIARIMGGESIADNHVELINEYAKMINVDTAKALGIEVPDDVLKDFVLIENK